MKYLLLALILLITPFSNVLAQVNTSLTSEGVVIELNPKNPEPNSIFTASLNNYSVAIPMSSITWRADGVVINEAENLRSISLQAPELGKASVIEASITFSNGGGEIVKRTLTPVYLDIIVEPQTKTPAFYQGRALPSIGSTVNLTAVVSGSGVSPSNLSYTWLVNNKAVNGGSVIGNNKTAIVMPPGQDALVTLSIQSYDGSISARKTISVKTVEPKLYFYELNSLYGLSNKPIKSLNLIGNSATVKAEPFNLDINTYNNPGLLEWEIGGEINQNKSTNPYEITLARSNDYSTGSSKASLHVRNLTQLLQGVRGEFQISF